MGGRSDPCRRAGPGVDGLVLRPAHPGLSQTSERSRHHRVRALNPMNPTVKLAHSQARPMTPVGANRSTSHTGRNPSAADTGISVAALEAYGNAELIAAESWPECHLRWNTLAGIGFVETRHGTYSGNLFGGSHLDENGVAVPSIIGVPLDGSPGFAEVPDTDGGALDNDSQFDRAVGPMQFIPESWNRYGRDADGDGTANPHQIDDAALGAANLLCANGRDLATPQGWAEAIRSYNFSEEYLINVRDAAGAYALRQPPV